MKTNINIRYKYFIHKYSTQTKKLTLVEQFSQEDFERIILEVSGEYTNASDEDHFGIFLVAKPSPKDAIAWLSNSGISTWYHNPELENSKTPAVAEILEYFKTINDPEEFLDFQQQLDLAEVYDDDISKRLDNAYSIFDAKTFIDSFGDSLSQTTVETLYLVSEYIDEITKSPDNLVANLMDLQADIETTMHLKNVPEGTYVKELVELLRKEKQKQVTNPVAITALELAIYSIVSLFLLKLYI